MIDPQLIKQIQEASDKLGIEVILQIFGGQACVLTTKGEDVIVHMVNDSPCELIIQLTKNNKSTRIKDILCKGIYQTGFLENIVGIINKYNTDEEYSIGHAFLYSSQPVNGYYKYKDLFQIMSVPDGSPIVLDRLMSDIHPFILEFKYKAFDVQIADYHISLNLRYEIELLLSVFLSSNIKSDIKVPRYAWGKELLEPKTESKYLSLTYHTQQYIPNKNAFSDTSHLQEFKKFYDPNYYELIGPLGEEITLNGNISDLFDFYFLLDKESQKRFLDACYWFSMACSLDMNSSSAKSLFFAMSMDRLLEDVKETKQCDHCGKLYNRSKSKAVLFEEMCNKLIPQSTQEQPNYKKFFNETRGKLAHGSVLDSDLNFFYRSGLLKQEFLLEMSYHSISRIILINWLAYKGLY